MRRAFVHRKAHSTYSSVLALPCSAVIHISTMLIPNYWRKSRASVRIRKTMELCCYSKLYERKIRSFSGNIDYLSRPFIFQQMTGSPLSAAKRLQFNLEVVPIPEIPQMANLQEMFLPLFWIEEAAHLNRTFTDQMKNSLFL